jgi:hypothetical protein
MTAREAPVIAKYFITTLNELAESQALADITDERQSMIRPKTGFAMQAR